MGLLVRWKDVDHYDRSICDALLVCRVAKTKCTCFAIVIAALIVSRSRISPINTTSGS
jgi:hypothetical protein